MKKTLSLTERLVGAAAIWIALTLLITGLGLSKLFASNIQRNLDSSLDDVIEGFTANVYEDKYGNLTTKYVPSFNAKFTRPLSGDYWQLYTVNNYQLIPHDTLKSHSLFGENIDIAPKYVYQLKKNFGEFSHNNMLRHSEGLRIAARMISVPDGKYPILIVVAKKTSDIIAEKKQFNIWLWSSLIILAVGLIIAIIFQVRIGLAPLIKMGRELKDVRNGAIYNLDEDLPRELAPLAIELNGLLDHNKEIVERGRTHVGNLAHALKTPISVMKNEAAIHDGPFGELVLRQTEAMSRQVEHYLKRAIAAARAETLRSSRTPIYPIIDDLVRTLARLYKREGVLIEVNGTTEAVFKGEKEDLEDMIGNLAENACKYGGGLVEISFYEGVAGRIAIIIDDDGEGLSAEEAIKALKRGVRLDETSKGSGLGLAIADELAKNYGGLVSLSQSSLGGLRAKIDIPVVETPN